MSVIIYQEHCDLLESEIEELKERVEFLELQLEYKTLGPPIFTTEEDK
jgi:hypothetical protein|tara:strand:- start:145 stop:288 length:144 start_codon:yes stop_codon:yes gene_type:complete